MANSTFPVKIGTRNSKSSARLFDGMRTGRISYTPGLRFAWVCDFDITLAGSLDAAASQEFDLHTYIASNPTVGPIFPSNVRVVGEDLYVTTTFSGGTVSDADAEVGDTGDPNGLRTLTDVFAATGWMANTTGAAEYAPHLETAFVPTLTITTTGDNVDGLTAGVVKVVIYFEPLPEV